MHCFRASRPASDWYVKIIEHYARNRTLQSGKRLHAQLIINTLARSTYVASKFITFYTECRQIHDARKLFNEIPKRNTRLWIVLVGAYARNGFHHNSMGLFREMQRERVEPNKFVIPSVLETCGQLSDLQTGKNLHAVILKQEFESDPFVISALIHMYSKCGKIKKARTVFDMLVEMDLVAMNTMVAGYVQHGLVNEALLLVEKTGIKPNLVTWNTLIAVFSQAKDDSNVAKLFQLMKKSGIDPDVVSWTSIISGFVQNIRNQKAFDSFKKMLGFGIRPTSATISSLLPAFANLADSSHGKEIHGYSIVLGVEKDVFVRSALIDMYAKCGFIYEAQTLFQTMSERNTVTWNSMIFGFANHGHCNEAITLFHQMVEEKVKLDHLTFTSFLTTCGQCGMVEICKKIFLIMQEEFKIEPRVEHYACMVHLLGQEWRLDEAWELIEGMGMEPDLFVWGALLGGCKIHGNVGLAEVAAKRVVELEPESAGSSLVLSNMYADFGSWGYAARVKRTIKKMKVKKLPGSRWIGVASSYKCYFM